MKIERLPFSIALADTVEMLLANNLIDLDKKDRLLDKRINGLYPEELDSLEAPKGYKDIILYLLEQGDFDRSEAILFIEEVERVGSPFFERERDKYFWCFGHEMIDDDSCPALRGRLSRRTVRFLASGAPDGEWHSEYVLACKDMKAQGYDIEGAKEMLLSITGKLTRDDMYQLKYAYSNNRFNFSYRSAFVRRKAIFK